MTDSITATPARTVVILGAGGYLGAALCQFFHALPSTHVVAVSRGKLNHSHFAEHVTADVVADDWAGQFGSRDSLVLINCAFDFKAIESGGRDEKFAILERNIAALARSPSARLINISSMSAYDGCRTDYGQEKLAVERLFSRHGGINVRPGLIASWRRPGAAFQNLIGIATGSRITPILTAPGSGFYLCDLEAVVLGIDLLARMKLNKPHTLSFCYRERIGLADVLRLIQRRNHTSSIKVPVPWLLAYGLLRVKEALVGRSKVRADSVLDFAYPNPSPLGRRSFAGMIARCRDDLAALPGAKSGAGDFYMLEPAQQRRSRSPLAPGVLASLGGLADP